MAGAATAAASGHAAGGAGASNSLKYVSLVALVFQNTILVLLMRYSRTQSGLQYLASAAVVCNEVLKLIASVFLLWFEFRSWPRVFDVVRTDVLYNYAGTLEAAVPSVLYTFQNNVLYVAVSNLRAETYQVTYQLKILTTLLFSVVMFGRKVHAAEIVSMLLLIAGVVLVQMDAQSAAEASKAAAAVERAQNPVLGLSAVIVACLSSGFAGVYFEMMLKGRGQQASAPHSLWTKNIQFALFGIALGLIPVFWQDGAAVRARGFFQGFNSVVWLVVLFQSIGGLVVAVVVKYADSILKGYATSVSIVLSAAVSFAVFLQLPSLQFIMGTVLVLIAVYLISLPAPKPAADQGLPMIVPRKE